jgi:hypothetical protein
MPQFVSPDLRNLLEKLCQIEKQKEIHFALMGEKSKMVTASFTGAVETPDDFEIMEMVVIG